MSWYRDNDGKIITDKEFQDDCFNCSAFCSEGTISIPCNGERTDCPYFKEVDTSEYDKKIRAEAIDDFVEKYKHCDNRGIQCKKALNCADCIAEQLKASLE